jgi:cytoskeletal protein CcmA (bactofilin family)
MSTQVIGNIRLLTGNRLVPNVFDKILNLTEAFPRTARRVEPPPMPGKIVAPPPAAAATPDAASPPSRFAESPAQVDEETSHEKEAVIAAEKETAVPEAASTKEATPVVTEEVTASEPAEPEHLAETDPETEAESPPSMNDKRITLQPSETYRPAAPSAGKTYGTSSSSSSLPSYGTGTGLGSTTSSSVSTEHAVLSADTEFRGALAFSGSLEMNGRLEGTIDSEDGTLTVGEDAVIKGEIRVHNAIVFGKVQGNITANGRIELRGPAQVFGDLRAMRIVVEEGVVFVGRSDVLRDSDNRADFSQIFQRLAKRE